MVALHQQQYRWTEAEYLEFERTAETKHEFYGGEIFAMAGTGRNHNRLTVSLTASLFPQLQGKGCEVFSNDMRVRVTENGLYTYPDVLVVCGEPDFLEDANPDTLLNPTVIIEVLSDSTEGYDRGKKFQLYRSLDSLREYVLISQRSAHIERFVRQENGDTWLFNEVVGLESSIALTTIDCTLALADVYNKVSFDAVDPLTPPGERISPV